MINYLILFIIEAITCLIFYFLVCKFIKLKAKKIDILYTIIITLFVCIAQSRFPYFFYSGKYIGDFKYATQGLIENPFLAYSVDLTDITLTTSLDEKGLLVNIESKDKRIALNGYAPSVIGYNSFILGEEDPETKEECKKFNTAVIYKYDLDTYIVHLNIVYTCDLANIGNLSFHNKFSGVARRDWSFSDFLYFIK